MSHSGFYVDSEKCLLAGRRNGEIVRREMGTALFQYRGVRGDSLVMFGEPGDAQLLGATTLEGFGFILDPFRRELKPMPMLL